MIPDRRGRVSRCPIRPAARVSAILNRARREDRLWGMHTCLFLLALLLGCPAAEAQDKKGKLDDFEEPYREKKEKKERKQEKSDDSRSSDDDDDDDDGIFESMLASMMEPVFDEVIVPVVGYPFIDHEMRFDDYPYATEGLLFYPGVDRSDKMFAAEINPYYLRIEHDLWAYGVEADVFLYSGADFRFDIVQYVEDLDGDTDRLTVQQYQVNYGLGGEPRNFQITVGWGVGVMKGRSLHTAFSMQAAFHLFAPEPLSFRASVALMSFTGRTMTDVEAEVRLHYNRFCLTLGLRSLINSRGDDLTGPSAGFMVWF
jgi:hypothetical protein